MKILKLAFTSIIISLFSCNNDHDGSNEVTYPIIYTADYFTEKITKVYTSEGEITDEVVLSNFLENNLDDTSLFNTEKELPKITIEYTSAEKGIITEVKNNQTTTKNVTIINQDGITYLEDEEETAQFIPSYPPFQLEEEENPFYKFKPLFNEIGERDNSKITDFPMFTISDNITFQERPGTSNALITKKSLYLE